MAEYIPNSAVPGSYPSSNTGADDSTVSYLLGGASPLYDVNQIAGPYDDVYILTNRYEKDNHIYMMGVSSPTAFQGASVAFCQLVAPTLLWISEWSCCRWNQQPIIPNPKSQNPNWELLDEHYMPGCVWVPPDGTTPFYRISGVYVYGNLNPSNMTINDIAYSRPPFLTDGAFVRTVSASVYMSFLNETNGNNGNSSASPGNPGSNTQSSIFPTPI